MSVDLCGEGLLFDDLDTLKDHVRRYCFSMAVGRRNCINESKRAILFCRVDVSNNVVKGWFN